jgi:hypothetical protein
VIARACLFGALTLATSLGAGCSETSSPERPQQPPEHKQASAKPEPFSHAELRWVARFGMWDRHYRAAREDAEFEIDGILGGKTTMREYRRKLSPLKRCGRNLRSIVGAPTLPELRAVYDLLAQGCARDAQLAGVSGQPNADQLDSFNSGKQLFVRGRALLARRLLANRKKLPRRGGASRESRVEPLLSKAAGAVIKSEVEVRCWSSRDWPRVAREFLVFSGYPTGDSAGFTISGRANLNPDACKTLGLLARGRHSNLHREADALDLLAYTAEVVSSPDQWAYETQCYAMQDIWPLGRSLGLSPRYATRLAHAYWTDLYPYQSASYRSDDCRNDGIFDRNSFTSRWP